jgi:4-hydroxy-tetrahydrodipicolinate reductase
LAAAICTLHNMSEAVSSPASTSGRRAGTDRTCGESLSAINGRLSNTKTLATPANQGRTAHPLPPHSPPNVLFWRSQHPCFSGAFWGPLHQGPRCPRQGFLAVACPAQTWVETEVRAAKYEKYELFQWEYEGIMSDMRLVVAGAGGRMGRTLIEAISDTDGAVLVGAIEAPGSAVIGRDAGELAGLGVNGILVTHEIEPLLAEADGILDFTVPTATVILAAQAARRGLVHVIGTTGLAAEQEGIVAAACATARIVKSGNMSLGVNLLAALVKRVARALDADFDIEILEMHHGRKTDAPSGTALLLGRAAAAGRNIDLARHAVRVRDGHPGARRSGDIGFASLRGGTVVGEHSVIFAGPHERIELVHKAEDRMIFARGAVKAALWAMERKPGLYSMADVLGLSDI